MEEGVPVPPVDVVVPLSSLPDVPPLSSVPPEDDEPDELEPEVDVGDTLVLSSLRHDVTKSAHASAIAVILVSFLILVGFLIVINCLPKVDSAPAAVVIKHI